MDQGGFEKKSTSFVPKQLIANGELPTITEEEVRKVFEDAQEDRRLAEGRPRPSRDGMRYL